jgi:hypothetical protein
MSRSYCSQWKVYQQCVSSSLYASGDLMFRGSQWDLDDKKDVPSHIIDLTRIHLKLHQEKRRCLPVAGSSPERLVAPGSTGRHLTFP